jgi:NADP-dependent 3-hydroxy acid dehydrogenase YdfG
VLYATDVFVDDLCDVRVTCLEPGAVATELADHISHPETRRGTAALYDAVGALSPRTTSPPCWSTP